MYNLTWWFFDWLGKAALVLHSPIFIRRIF